MKEVYTAFIKAQMEMGHAVKDGKNPHFRSAYATLPQVLDIVLEAFGKHDLGLIQMPGISENGAVTVKTLLTHSSGETFDCGTMSAWPKDQGPQAIGSCVTYLRRYSLMSICGIGQIDDDANAAEGIKIQKPEIQAMAEQKKQSLPDDNGLSYWSNQINIAKDEESLKKISAKIQQDNSLIEKQVETLRSIYKVRLEQLKGAK